MANAREMNDDNADILESSLEKLKAKLTDAKTALQNTEQEAGITETSTTKKEEPASDPNDPIQAAIERAKASRAGSA